MRHVVRVVPPPREVRRQILAGGWKLTSAPTATGQSAGCTTTSNTGRLILVPNTALRFEPKLASALYGRGLARLKKGDKVGSDADISAAKKIQAKIGNDFTRYGVQ